MLNSGGVQPQFLGSSASTPGALTLLLPSHVALLGPGPRVGGLGRMAISYPSLAYAAMISIYFGQTCRITEPWLDLGQEVLEAAKSRSCLTFSGCPPVMSPSWKSSPRGPRLVKNDIQHLRKRIHQDWISPNLS